MMCCHILSYFYYILKRHLQLGETELKICITLQPISSPSCHNATFGQSPLLVTLWRPKGTSDGIFRRSGIPHTYPVFNSRWRILMWGGIFLFGSTFTPGSQWTRKHHKTDRLKNSSNPHTRRVMAAVTFFFKSSILFEQSP